jgi:hypothetical protein
VRVSIAFASDESAIFWLPTAFASGADATMRRFATFASGADATMRGFVANETGFVARASGRERKDERVGRSHGRRRFSLARGYTSFGADARSTPLATRGGWDSLAPSSGRITSSDVTLERGATQVRDLFDWLQDVAITLSGLGLTDVSYKRNLDITQRARDGLTLRRWSRALVAGEGRRGRVGQRER